MTDNVYRICSPPVAHETIDGEVVIVNLHSGFYYSLQGTGGEIWALLAIGTAGPAIAEHLRSQYRDPEGILDSELARFLDQLQAEGIIVPCEQASGAQRDLTGSSCPRPEQQASVPDFTPLVLHKFTDMRDLLRLDPIHEVDEGGWPHPLDAAA